MYLGETDISCGIAQLYGIGKATQDQYDECIEGWKEYGNYAAMIIASLTSKQKKAIKLLEKNGFKMVGRWKKNPNSNNKIALFVKRCNRKKMSHTSERYW